MSEGGLGIPGLGATGEQLGALGGAGSPAAGALGELGSEAARAVIEFRIRPSASGLPRRSRDLRSALCDGVDKLIDFAESLATATTAQRTGASSCDRKSCKVVEWLDISKN